MIRDSRGDKVFENTTEALFLIGEWTFEVLSWLKQLRDEYGIQLPMFPMYKSKIHDIAMVTKRFIVEQHERQQYLTEKLHQISEDNLCPRCQAQTPKVRNTSTDDLPV